MPAIQSRKIYQDFSAGLNDRVSAIQLKQNESSVISNAVVNNRGLLEKINGYIKDGSPFPNNSDSFIRMLLNLRIGTSVDILLMAAQDDNNSNSTYKVDLKKTSGDSTYQYIGHTTGTADFNAGSNSVTGHGTTWLSKLKAGDKIKAGPDPDANYVEILSVNSDTSITLVSNYINSEGNVPYIARIILNKNNMPRGIVFDNKAIITNGSETPMTYNNTSLELITDTDAPKAKYIEAHKQRVFMASTGAFPSRIFWSAVNDEQTWDPASEEDIFPQDNGTIVAIKSFADSLLVFKNSGSSNALYQVIGNFDQDAVGSPTYIRKVETWENIGIIAERSPVIHNGYCYFIAETGLYRIDQRMSVEKVTYNIDNFIKSLNFSLGPTSSKAYTFDSAAQWGTGTQDGIRVNVGGSIQNYFDSATISDCLVTNAGISTKIDSSLNVHVAYISASNNKVIKYFKLNQDNTSLSETVTTEVQNIQSVAIAIAPNNNVGILFKEIDPTTGPASVNFWFIERDNGTGLWGSPTLAFGGGIGSADTTIERGLALVYNTSNDPRGAVCVSGNGDNTGIAFVKRISGTWSHVVVASNNQHTYELTLILDASQNPKISSVDITNSQLGHFSSSNDGSSWTLVEDIPLSSTASGVNPILSINNAGQAITGYNDNGVIKKRNHSTATTSTVVSGSNKLYGYISFYDPVALADQDYVYYSVSGTEKFYFESTSTITDSSSEVNSTGYIINNGFSNFGRVFASIAYSSSSNQAMIRRSSFRGIWTSPENSDNGLTAWGTYVVNGQVTNSGTITHQIALNSVHPATVFNNIVTGALISTDPTQIFIINKINIVLGIFSSPVIDSIVDNYTGAGIDAKQILGLSFNNELYYAGTTSGGHTSNNTSLILDKFGSFLRPDYPVSAMERFKKQLYAGNSSNGDLLILQQGYDFAGSTYTMDVQFKEDFLDSIELEKDIYKIYVLYEVKSAGNFIFSYRLDSFATSGGSSWVNSTVDQTQEGFFEIPVGEKARSIQCRIQNSQSNPSALIAFLIVNGQLNIR